LSSEVGALGDFSIGGRVETPFDLEIVVGDTVVLLHHLQP
jgi:hypothetical protein